MNPSALCILSTRNHYFCRFVASEGWEIGFIYLIDIYVEEPVDIQFVVISKVWQYNQ